MEEVALIYIDYSDGRNFSFEKPLLQKFREQFPGRVIFDIDLASDQLLYGYVHKIIEQTPFCFLIIEKQQEAESANKAHLIQLLSSVRKQAEKVKAAFIGQDPTVEKLLSLLKDRAILNCSSEEAFSFISAEISAIQPNQ